MTKLEIRQAKKEDTQELIALYTETMHRAMVLEEVDENEIDDFVGDEVNYKSKNLRDAFDNDNNIERVFLVAVMDDKIIGTIGYGPCSDIIDEHGGRDTKGLNEIGSAYVLPEYQSKGVMNVLFNAIILTLRARGIDEICLDSGYMIAKKIWEKKLGKPNVILRDFWDEGVDHHIWYRDPKNILCEYWL